jgi:hypothetical protein
MRDAASDVGLTTALQLSLPFLSVQWKEKNRLTEYAQRKCCALWCNQGVMQARYWAKSEAPGPQNGLPILAHLARQATSQQSLLTQIVTLDNSRTQAASHTFYLLFSQGACPLASPCGQILL